MASINRKENYPSDRQTWLALSICLNRLLDEQVSSLMHQVFELEELNGIQNNRTEYLIALRRTNKLDSLRDLLRELHPEVYNDVFLKLFSNVEDLDKRHVIFQNRVQELDKILLEPFTNPISSCWLVMGPSGYGKTEFLEELAVRFLHRNWLVTFAKLNNGLSTIVDQIWKESDFILDEKSDNTHVLGRKFATLLVKNLENRPGFVLLLDDIDMANETVLKETESFVRGIIDGWNDFGIKKSHSLRIISTAKRIDESEKFGRLGSDVIMLSPFNFKVVRDTVEHFQKSVGFDLDDMIVNSATAYLCHITGGHPGCLSSLLEKFYSETLFVGPWPKEDEMQHYRQVGSVLEKIKESIPHKHNIQLDLFDLFEQLCVIRRFNEGILEEFLAQEQINYPVKDASRISEILLQSRLLDRKPGGLLGDNITRRLFFCSLRNGGQDKINKLRDICNFAIQAYSKRLSDRSYIRNWHVYAVEIIYQQIINLYYVQGIRGEHLEKIILKEKLPWVLDILVENENIDRHERVAAIDYFINDFNEWEMRFLVNYTMSQNHFSDEIFEKIMHFIKDFQQAI